LVVDAPKLPHSVGCKSPTLFNKFTEGIMLSEKRKLNKNNTSGAKGLTFLPLWKKWNCRIAYKKNIYRAYFDEGDKNKAIEWLTNTRKELNERDKANYKSMS